MLGIFLDFSKAFDTIDHKTLLDKLKNLYFSNTSIELVANYLSNRQQLTMVNDTFSSLSNMACGVKPFAQPKLTHMTTT